MADSFGEVEKRYAALRGQFQSRMLSKEQWTAAVNSLRAADAAGRTWQISPDTGKWIVWDGSQWLPGNPRADVYDAAVERYRAYRAMRKAGQMDESSFVAAVTRTFAG